MSYRRPKLSISFPRGREHVLTLLQEHCQVTKQTNRSAAVITLLEKALTTPTPDSDNTMGLYELERLSKQMEEYHQRIEELSQMIMAQNEGTEVDEEVWQDPGLPDEHGEESDGNAAHGQRDGDSHMVINDDESADGQDEEPNVEENVSEDNIVPEPPKDSQLASTSVTAWINSNPTSTSKH